MSTCNNKEHHACCSHTGSSYGCDQSIDEIEFEKSIFNACVYGDIDKVKKFVAKKGKDILLERDKSGYTCLHYAARNGHLEICKYLIEQDADLNAKTLSCNSAPIHRASLMGHWEIVQLLLNKKANPLEKDYESKTALHKCAEKLNEKSSKYENYLKTAKSLLSFNSNLINEEDNNKNTPLNICPELKTILN